MASRDVSLVWPNVVKIFGNGSRPLNTNAFRFTLLIALLSHSICTQVAINNIPINVAVILTTLLSTGNCDSGSVQCLACGLMTEKSGLGVGSWQM